MAMVMRERSDTPTRWDGCYKDGWQGLIVSDARTDADQGSLFARGEDYSAFEHPAKVSRSLIRRIYWHLVTHYGLTPGMTVLDPFAGVGLHALDCLLLGYHFVGVELEPKFHTLSLKNLEYWRHKFGPQPGTVRLLQGDSRGLREVVSTAGCLVSSPPWAKTAASDYHLDSSPGRFAKLYATYQANGGGMTAEQYRATCQKQQGGYGETAGQLGAMPEGSFDACISSPPYAKGCAHTGGADKHPEHIQGGTQGVGIGYAVSSPPYAASVNDGRIRDDPKSHREDRTQWHGYTRAGQHSCAAYGHAAGQLGAMPEGSFDGLISSPPYSGKNQGDGGKRGTQEKPGMIDMRHAYGETPGQLNNEPSQTFWSEVSKVIAECYAILVPGAYAAWIVKSYVRQKAIVDFPGQWQALCEHHGFTLVERIEASLITRHGTEETLWGETVTRASKKQSFFRALAEKKGSPPIDAEVVLICQKPS